MDGHLPAALQEEYCALVVQTIQRYVADGHPLGIETTKLEEVVRVALDFDPSLFAEYFAHMGGVVETSMPVARHEAPLLLGPGPSVPRLLRVGQAPAWS